MGDIIYEATGRNDHGNAALEAYAIHHRCPMATVGPASPNRPLCLEQVYNHSLSSQLPKTSATSHPTGKSKTAKRPACPTGDDNL